MAYKKCRFSKQYTPPQKHYISPKISPKGPPLLEKPPKTPQKTLCLTTTYKLT
jgi:hypothetical protein